MKHAGVFVTVLAICTAAAAAVRQFSAEPTEPDVVATDSYFSPDFGELKLLGLCNVFGQKIKCWDVNRNPNLDLAKQVTTLLTKGPGVGNLAPPTITFRFRRKNRLVVFQLPFQRGEPGQAQFSAISIPGTSYVQQIFAPSTAGSPVLNFYPLDADRDATSLSITAKLNSPSAPALDVPCREGGTAQSGSRSVTIGFVKRIPGTAHMARWETNNGNWQVLIKLSGDTPWSREEINVQPLDAHGQAILNVDAAGKPIVRPKPGTIDESTFMTSFGRNIYFPLPIGQFQPALGGRVWITSVNPKYIGALRMNFWKGRYIQFKDCPLDPKP